MSLRELGTKVAELFEAAYGRTPRWIAAAPGRVNVIGEHTDYNDGFVLPMAIDRYTIIAAAPSLDESRVMQLRSTIGNGAVSFDLSKALRPGENGAWSNYPVGVVAGFLNLGARPGGFDALIHSTVPTGGGLSSSAALEVSTATLLETITANTLDPVDKALLCQKAEHDFAGMPCGIMDQFISAMGRKDHLLLLDCRSRKTELVPMTDPSVSLLITNTNVKHELTSGEYAKRRAQCEEAAASLGVPSLRDATTDMLQKARGKMDEIAFRRARHVIGEIERTVNAAKAVHASDWPKLGELMYASHSSLRDDYEVSCPELDEVVNIAREIGPDGGMIGCRMTGGGFGGCTVALIRSDAVDRISGKVAAEYEKRTKIKPTLFVSRPAAGATVVKG